MTFSCLVVYGRMNDEEEVDRAMLCRLIGLPLACSNCPFIAVQEEGTHGLEWDCSGRECFDYDDG